MFGFGLRDGLRFAAFTTLGLLVGLLFATPAEGQEFRSIEGTDNNLSQPEWGSAETPLLRLAPAGYGDGNSTPAGATRPSAREISNALCAQPAVIMNAMLASDFVWQWGQFLDHDVDLTETHDPSLSPSEFLPIAVPMGDPHFDPMMSGSQMIPMARSLFEPGSSPRAQLNSITAFVDASNVYGSDATRANALRTLDGTGRLLTSAGELLPYNDAGLPNGQVDGLDPALFFLAGDVRANEQVGLIALHTLFVREHNRLATEILANEPGLTGEEVYLRARRIVGAQMQVITYEEFLPVLLGPAALTVYTGYDPAVDPGIANEFSTAAYRVGHTMLAPLLLRYEEHGGSIELGDLPLQSAFFDPTRISAEGGIDPILRGLASRAAQTVDTQVVDDVRNFLFGPPGSGGFDLASLNIQRGRDHGLADYNSVRVAYGLPALTDFADIHPDPAIHGVFATLYSSVNDIDPWVGMLAEPHVPGALVGETVRAVLADQFERLRDGDRFWYEIDLSGPLLAEVSSTRLADIIRRNTDIDAISDDVFTVPAFRRGDCNADGFVDLGDAIEHLGVILLDGTPMGCEKACDSNDDGRGDLADAIFTIQFLFGGGAAPNTPYPDCGHDVTDDLRGCYVGTTCP